MLQLLSLKGGLLQSGLRVCVGVTKQYSYSCEVTGSDTLSFLTASLHVLHQRVSLKGSLCHSQV